MNKRMAIVLRVALLSATSISLMAGSCSPTKRLLQAADDTGRAQAQVLLPNWPEHCKLHVPYAGGTLGMDPVSLDKLDRGQIDFANQKLDWCADHYAQLQAALAKATAR